MLRAEARRIAVASASTASSSLKPYLEFHVTQLHPADFEEAEKDQLAVMDANMRLQYKLFGHCGSAQRRA